MSAALAFIWTETEYAKLATQDVSAASTDFKMDVYPAPTMLSSKTESVSALQDSASTPTEFVHL